MEVETDEYRCLKCGRYIVSCRSGPLRVCAYHNPPIYFRIDANDRVVDFRIKAAREAPERKEAGDGQ